MEKRGDWCKDGSKNIRCYNYGVLGHLSKNCKAPNNGPPGQARLNAIIPKVVRYEKGGEYEEA